MTSSSSLALRIDAGAGFTSALDSIIFTLYSSQRRRWTLLTPRLVQLRLPAEPARPLTPPAAVCARFLPASVLIHPPASRSRSPPHITY